MATRAEPRPPRSLDFVPLALILVLAARTVWQWRFFPYMVHDDSWPLRAAERVAAGEHIYTDIGWVYGPLPVWSIGLLFRLRRDVGWDSLLDSILGVAAVGAVWCIATRLAGRRTGSWITLWTALLGAPIGLISYQLTTYTSAVAWGSALSLLATAMALQWVQSASHLALATAFSMAAGAVFSKPEFGLAGLCVFIAALWLRRPSRHIMAGAATCLVGAIIIACLFVDASTWHAWWRGYSGYDLFDTKMVPIVVPDRVLGGVALAAGLALCLWWRPASLLIAVVGALLVAAIIVRDLTTHGMFPRGLAELLHLTWAGVVPGLAWIGWRARARLRSPGFWIAWVYVLCVNFRFFLYGEFCAAATGPAAAMTCLAMRERWLPQPMRVGWCALAIVMLASLQSEINAITRPRHAARLDTRFGSIRVPPRTAAAIENVRATLDAAPPGTLFVSGAGPLWYLLSGRQNPTAFDMLIPGMGTTAPEVARLLADVRTHPPTLVILEDEPMSTDDYSTDILWRAIGQVYTPLAPTPPWHVYVAENARAP